MKQCKQCGRIFKRNMEKDIICDNCKRENEKNLKHLKKEKNLNCCINKIFLIDNVVYSNYFLPLLVKLQINQSAAIRKLIEYAVINPDILTDKKSLSTIDKFVNYLIENVNNTVTKADLRATKFINGNKFKSFWDKNIIEITQKLKIQGYNLYEVKGYKNSVSYVIMEEK